MFYFTIRLRRRIARAYFNFISHCTSIVIVLTACSGHARPEGPQDGDGKENAVVKVIYDDDVIS